MYKANANTFPIACLHSGVRHDETIGWFLFITHYYITQIGTPTNKVWILR